jgi:nitrate/TMAO reductase-like tetraheme cytochrome c subunit
MSTARTFFTALVVGAGALASGIWLAKQLDLGDPSQPAPPPEPPAAVAAEPDYLRAVYSPLHFRPAIDTATDAQCLACHREVLDDRVRETSPAGARAAAAKAWYQQLSTYAGEQETFHRRHLETPFAKQVMQLKCNTCHQGHDPREAAGTPRTVAEVDFTLRKKVNPETSCLKCHGQMAWQLMGLPGPWPEVKATFADNCNTCHAGIRTVRHQVSYLKAEAIEEAAKQGGDVCYGCHGGRAWYRIAYPYPRHAWPGMATEVPDWARQRPTESEPRFRLQTTAAQAAAPADTAKQ